MAGHQNRTKNFLYILLIMLCISACSSSRQGRVKQGADGKFLKASIVARCTEPQKAYSKELKTHLKAEVDSLQFVPKANFDAAFEQKIVKLKDYSSNGLDLDLLTFRICEMANNRGFTSEQTYSLIEKVTSIWNNKSTFYQTVTSTNQQGGITAGIVVVPEDKEIPLENNFSVIERKTNNKESFEIKPRQGVWYNPFIAYPAAEDSVVKGDISNMMGIQMRGTDTREITYKGNKLIVKLMQINQTSITPDNAYYFFFNKKPTLFFFGDITNPRKQYINIP